LYNLTHRLSHVKAFNDMVQQLRVCKSYKTLAIKISNKYYYLSMFFQVKNKSAHV